jgi:hypothetical protein
VDGYHDNSPTRLPLGTEDSDVGLERWIQKLHDFAWAPFRYFVDRSLNT